VLALLQRNFPADFVKLVSIVAMLFNQAPGNHIYAFGDTDRD
jgi:hypothetical protein